MKERQPEKRELTRREFLGKTLFPAVGFGLLSLSLGKLWPDGPRGRKQGPNVSLKEANHYSKLAG